MGAARQQEGEYYSATDFQTCLHLCFSFPPNYTNSARTLGAVAHTQPVMQVMAKPTPLTTVKIEPYYGKGGDTLPLTSPAFLGERLLRKILFNS